MHGSLSSGQSGSWWSGVEGWTKVADYIEQTKFRRVVGAMVQCAAGCEESGQQACTDWQTAYAIIQSLAQRQEHAAVAQWIEYWPPKPRVVGSIPASRANIK